ncbi:hypothetical protein ACYATO_08590 [Lactobacillaceae bacterium Melli_B3]
MKIKKTYIAAALLILGIGYFRLNPTAKAVGIDTSHMSKKPVNYGKYVSTYPKWIRGTWYSYSDDSLYRIKYTKHSYNSELAKNNDGNIFYKNKPSTLHYYSKGHTNEKNWMYAQVGSSNNIYNSYKIKIPYSNKVLVSNSFNEPPMYAVISSLHKYGSNEALVEKYGLGYNATTGYFRSISVAKHYEHKSLPGFGKQY